MTMKKRKIAMLLAGMLAAAALLGGCTTKTDQKAQEYKELGISRMDEGDYAGAAESFQKALDLSSGIIGAEELDLCYYKALALFKSGDSDGAIEAYTALIDYDDDNWEVYYLRGHVYLADGQNEAALADYAEAFSLNENDIELCVHIYEDLSDAGLGDSGQAYYDQVMTIQPSDAEEYYFVGDMYFLTGDYENAKTNLEQAEAQGYDKALLMLGQIYASEGDSESAKTAFSSYMEKYPDDAEALSELGGIALSSGEYADAVTYLESALDVSDGSLDKTIEKKLIAAYEYSGDFESAYHMAKSFLKEYSDEEVEREYEFLQTRVDGLNQSDTEGTDETADTDSAADANTDADASTDTDANTDTDVDTDTDANTDKDENTNTDAG